MKDKKEPLGRRWVVPAYAAVVVAIILLSAIAGRFESGPVVALERTNHMP